MAPADETRATATDLRTKTQDFFRTVDEVLRVPGPLPIDPAVIEAIRRGMQELSDKARELFATIDEFLSTAGDSDRLRQVAATWSEVGNAVGATATSVSPDRVATGIEWSGSAAEAYRQVVPAQGAALARIKTVGVSTSTSLNALADAIDSFWLAVGLALAAAVVGIVSAAASAVGVVTLPAGIAVAAGALITCLGLVSAALLQTNAAMDRVDSENP